MSVNKVILLGRVGGEPKVSSLRDGDTMATFSLATFETWKDKDTGEKKEKVEWHNVAIFNSQLVILAERFITKGSLIYLEGELSTKKFTDKNGVEKSVTQIVLPKFRGMIKLLGEKPKGNDALKESSGTNIPEQKTEKSNVSALQDDEIPF